MDYLKLLNESYIIMNANNKLMSKLEYLSEHIFEFDTYDSEISSLFGKRALMVCMAITENETFDLVGDRAKYEWFLIMINTRFFIDKLDWASSVRGCWWGGILRLDSCGLYNNGEQIHESLDFTQSEWNQLIYAMNSFAYDI